MQLREARRHKFLTQKRLAELVGVGEGVVTEWERGTYQPSLANQKKLCDLLGVSPEEIEFPPRRLKGKGQ